MGVHVHVLPAKIRGVGQVNEMEIKRQDARRHELVGEGKVKVLAGSGRVGD